MGLDTRLSILEYLHRSMGEKYRPCPLLGEYVKAGRLGRKVGKGCSNTEPGHRLTLVVIQRPTRRNGRRSRPAQDPQEAVRVFLDWSHRKSPRQKIFIWLSALICVDAGWYARSGRAESAMSVDKGPAGGTTVYGFDLAGPRTDITRARRGVDPRIMVLPECQRDGGSAWCHGSAGKKGWQLDPGTP